MPTLLDRYNQNPRAFRFRSRNGYGRSTFLGTFYDTYGNRYPNYAALRYEVGLCLDNTNSPVNGKYYGGSFFGLDRYGYHHNPGGANCFSSYYGVNQSGNLNKSHYEGNIIGGVPPAYVSRYGESAYEDAFRGVFENETDQLGAKALSNLRPDSPLIDSATAIAELRDIPRSLHQRFNIGDKPLKGISDLALAYQFGWAPLFRDVRDFVTKSFDVNRTLNQLIRDEGRLIRRFRNLHDKTVTRDPVVGSGYGSVGSQSFTTDYYVGVPSHIDVCKVTDRAWASGVFTYSLPGGDRTQLWQNNVRRKILGLELSPAVVYNLIPWSFVLDYFTDVGDYVDAIYGSSTVDRLNVSSAFVMRHKRGSVERQANYALRGRDGGVVNGVLSCVTFSESKRRTVIDASSPGVDFGKDPSDFESAILGLLGLSRLP